MNHNHVLMTLASSFVLFGAPTSALANEQPTCEPEPIPLVVVTTSDQTGYIIPNCSKCKKLALHRQNNTTGGTEGRLELTYHGDEDFVGSIVLTVVSSDDTEHLVEIEDVDLTEGEVATWVLEDPITWDLADASVAWIEFVDA